MTTGRSRTHRTRAVLGILIATYTLTLAGCAARQMPIRIKRDIASNPQSGITVHILPVQDRRTFEVSGTDPVPHQIATKGVEDAGIRARSIAQIRGAGAKPIADLLLPEGQSAATLTRDSLVEAFRGAGFVVLEPDDRGFPDSIPVNAAILRFWSWNTGSWAFTFQFESVVLITANIPPFEQGKEVQGHVRLHSAVGASERSFRNTTNKGIDDFVANVQSRLEEGKRQSPSSEPDRQPDVPD